jgi:hypothetical protein
VVLGLVPVDAGDGAGGTGGLDRLRVDQLSEEGVDQLLAAADLVTLARTAYLYGRTDISRDGQSAVCAICHQPMKVTEPGQTTHPSCDQ